jgi:hypothetical protein
MHASAPIGVDGRRPDYFGQLASRITTDEVHLKKTILTVDETKRIREIKSITTGYGWNSSCVPDNTDGGSEIGHHDSAIQLRQACANGQPRQACYDHDGRKKCCKQTNDPALHRELLCRGDFENLHRVSAARHAFKVAFSEDNEVIDLDEFIV